MFLDREHVLTIVDAMPKVTGWERNRDKKLLPQKADLSIVMDPKKYVKSNHRIIIN